jgi:hypothetical protein
MAMPTAGFPLAAADAPPAAAATRSPAKRQPPSWTKASRSPGRKIDPVAEKQSLGGGGRYVVGDLPVTNGTNRQRACGCSNVVLFGLMHFSFCILYASTRRRLHTQADAGGHTGIICNAVGYRVFSDNQDGCRIASFRNVAGSTPVASSRCSRCIIFGS